MVKTKISCSLQNWLKKYDKKLFSAAEDACVLGLLNPGRFGGITFLYPKDAKLHKKLISDLSDNSMSGVNMFRSMIVTDYLPTTEEWMHKKDDIPNRLGLKVEVKDGDRKKITLKNGAVIEPLPEFKAREDRTNMCVWKYKGPAMPLEGKKAERKYTKKGAPPIQKKKGGFFKSKVSPNCVAKMCEAKAVNNLKMGTHTKNNCHLDTLCSYLCYLEKNNPTQLENICCILSYCPMATFYNVFEPYVKNSAPPLFDDWVEKTKGVCLELSPAAKYMQFVDQAISKSNDLRNMTGNERVKILDNRTPHTLRKELLSIYKKNLTAYGAMYTNGMRKALHDETRFLIDDKMTDVTDPSSLKDLFFEIECMQRAGYNNGTYIMTDMISSENDRFDIAGFYSTAVSFLLSDCFMYAPYDPDNKDQLKELAHDENDSPPRVIPISSIKLGDFMGENVLFVTEERCKEMLERLAKNQMNESNGVQDAFAQVLNLLDDPSKLSPSLKNAIDRLANMKQ